MKICGIKTTHDGGVALIDDGRLIFSVEMEKLDNSPRYSKIGDYRIVFDLLVAHGYDPSDIDLYVFDGWYKTVKPRVWFGQDVEIVLAPYRRGLADASVMGEYSGRVLDIDYVSYTHYAGHIASGYCTSPAARRGEDGLVLAWDGWMFPFLYEVDVATGQARNLGSPLPLIGNSYYKLCQTFSPFDHEIVFPQELGLAGKIMAYEALGESQGPVVESLRAAIWSAARDVLGSWPADDLRLQRDAGVEVLDLIQERFTADGFDDADAIASVHHCLGDELLAGIERLLLAADTSARHLTVVGGCGLNIKWNSQLRDSGLFDDVWVPPFPNDAGSALGTACAAMLGRTSHRALDWNVYTGPALKAAQPRKGWSARACSVKGLAQLLAAAGDPVVVLTGRAELGPRALGHRSIISSATDPSMKDRLNDIKMREPYRPVAPICLEDRASEIFDPGTPDPYMLFDHAVTSAWVDQIPAVVHLDGTARLQTVGAHDDPFVFELLQEYDALTGVPVLCNTSANGHGTGFFPDVGSAMDWGGTDLIWSDGTLYSRDAASGAQP